MWNDICTTLLKYHEDGNKEECIRTLKHLQCVILQDVKKCEGCEYDLSFYSALIGILTREVSNYSKEIGDDASINIISSVFCCLRNSFYKNPSNQLKVSQNENLIRELIKSSDLLLEVVTSSSDNNGKSMELAKQALDSCATCFVNMMAGNMEARKHVWGHFQPLYRKAIFVSPWEVGHLFCAALHNFLQENIIRKSIISGPTFEMFVHKLLSLYLHEGPNSCFVLFCLKDFLCCTNVILSFWDTLSLEESLLTLDILSSTIISTSPDKEGDPLPPWQIIQFFCERFKKDADKILRIHGDQLHLIEPKKTARLLSLICTSAASDSFLKLMQNDKSLLITTIYLLRGTKESGHSSSESSSLINEAPNQKSDLDAAPSHAFGFKSDLVRLIAPLVFRNKENQDIVRENKGMELLLESTQFDTQNPIIKENSIFALRNLLEGNERNQEYLKSFSLKGMAPNSVLQELGLEAEISEGKLQIRQLE